MVYFIKKNKHFTQITILMNLCTWTPPSTHPLVLSTCHKFTSRSIISLGAGASGLSPVSSIGIPSFFTSFSKNPAKQKHRFLSKEGEKKKN